MERVAAAAWWRPRPAAGAGEAARRPFSSPPAERGAVPFAALILFTFVSVAAPQSFVPALEPLHLALITASLAAASCLLSRLTRGLPILGFDVEMRIACALLAWTALTLPFSVWPGGSLEFLSGIFLKTVMVFWLVGHVVDSVRRVRWVLWTLTLMAVPLALTAVTHFASGEYVLNGSHGEVRRIVGYDAPLAQNPNDLALMLNLILPLSIALLLASEGASVRALLLSLIALDVVATVATFSRAGFLTLAAIGAIYLGKLIRRPGRGWAWAALAALLLGIPLLPPDYLGRLGTITDVDADPTGSSQARLGDTLAALGYVSRHPLVGPGVGTNTLALNLERGPLWKEVHNAYLECAVELGLPGLVLFLLLMRSCFRRVATVRRASAGHPDLREPFLLAEGIEMSLAAFALAALFHPAAYHLYFYYIAGLAVALDRACARARRP